MKEYEKLNELIEQVCEEEGVELEDIYIMPQEDNACKINQFEERFEVELPEDYKYFILKYGSGGLGYFDFFGIESGKEDVSKSTLALLTRECREKGMPEQLVVIMHNGDYVTCIDTSKKGEGEVVTWSWLDGGNIVKVADTFEAFFIERLEDCL